MEEINFNSLIDNHPAAFAMDKERVEKMRSRFSEPTIAKRQRLSDDELDSVEQVGARFYMNIGGHLWLAPDGQPQLYEVTRIGMSCIFYAPVYFTLVPYGIVMPPGLAISFQKMEVYISAIVTDRPGGKVMQYSEWEAAYKREQRERRDAQRSRTASLAGGLKLIKDAARDEESYIDNVRTRLELHRSKERRAEDGDGRGNPFIGLFQTSDMQRDCDSRWRRALQYTWRVCTPWIERG